MSEAREVYCVKCGCIESAEEMVYVASNDSYYCRSCAESEGFVQCEHCGGWHHIDDMTVVHTPNGEESWCDDCRALHAFECEHCGEWYSDDYAYRTVRDDYVCEDCLHEYYTLCDSCDEYYPNDDVYHSGGRTICCECAPYDDYWHYCEECGDWVYESEWDYDSECCNDCIRVQRRSQNARVRSYHGDEPRMQYFGKYGDVFKGLGIELEIDRDCSDAKEKQHCLNELDELFGSHGYFKYDGSLHNGIEIVTLPHTIDAFYKLPWKEILEVCVNRGYSSHQIGTCGLHVHLSRTLFGDDEDMQSDNIAKLMQFYNIYWDDVLKVSRRTNEQVMQWASKYPTVRKDSLKKWATKKDKYHCRYMAVNVTNDATVEIRINRGTLKLSTFLATIDFVYTTAINSAKIDWSDVSDDFQWLKGLKKDTLDYIQSRNAFYEPVNKYINDYWIAENERRTAEFERQRQEVEAANAEEPQLPSDFDEIMAMLESLSSEQPF